MSDLQTVTVHQAPILFLARGLGSAVDAQAFYNIVEAEFPAPILEPTLRERFKSIRMTIGPASAGGLLPPGDFVPEQRYGLG